MLCISIRISIFRTIIIWNIECSHSMARKRMVLSLFHYHFLSQNFDDIVFWYNDIIFNTRIKDIFCLFCFTLCNAIFNCNICTAYYSYQDMTIGSCSILNFELFHFLYFYLLVMFTRCKYPTLKSIFTSKGNWKSLLATKLREKFWVNILKNFLKVHTLSTWNGTKRAHLAMK